MIGNYLRRENSDPETVDLQLLIKQISQEIFDIKSHGSSREI